MKKWCKYILLVLMLSLLLCACSDNEGHGESLSDTEPQESEIVTDEKEATGTMVQYDSLRVEYPKTADNIFGTLLTAKYPAKTESKLVNEYQSAELGLLPEDAKIPYQEFLKDRLAIRAMVDADCETYNIPMDL